MLRPYRGELTLLGGKQDNGEGYQERPPINDKAMQAPPRDDLEADSIPF